MYNQVNQQLINQQKDINDPNHNEKIDSDLDNFNGSPISQEDKIYEKE